jgi:inactivated superfamily I helicase
MSQKMNLAARCIMAPAEGSFFSFTAEWLQNISSPLSWHEWTIYVPYARCIPWLQRAFFHLNAQETLPHITALSVPHPVSFEYRLGWMLSFLTPVVPHLPLEHRLNLAQEALSVWEQSIFFETPWAYLSHVEETRLTQHHSIAVALLKHIAFDWPVFLQEKTDAYVKHSFIPQHNTKRPSVLVGSHGSLPTTRHLMRALLQSPQGWVIFPPTPAFGEEAHHPHHPLYAFVQTLTFLKIQYHDIVQWESKKNGPDSALLPQEAFLRGYVPSASLTTLTHAISVTVCATPMEEARHVADTAMRYAKEGISVLCVSPDPVLAHSIVQRLHHANVSVLEHEALSL